MYTRPAFSVAVHVDSDILLLDEVLSVADASFAEKSRAQIENFKKEEKTILFVSHDLQAVENWCHNVLWLEHGRTAMYGRAADVVGDYRTKYHAAGEVTLP